MFRYLLLGVWFSLVLAVGCGTQAPPKVEVEPEPGKAQGGPALPAKGEPLFATSTAAKIQEKLDAILSVALKLLAEKKYQEALTVLETAQVLEDSDAIKQEIERVHGLLTQQKAADQTAADIQTILNDGDADQAQKLATDALAQFGGGDSATKLVLLKQQADALKAQSFDDMAERKEFFAKQALSALKDQNLRAAVIAFNQALEIGADADLRQQRDEVQGRVDQYDNGRAKALELRQDAYQLEDALVFLNDAAKAWDTAEIRQDIADAHLALTRRRDRVGVADFEIRGEIGIAQAGRTFAEELLPHFRVKYDVVERAQLNKVIEELQLQDDELAENDAGRRELAKLSRVRYLVLGSVTRLGGVTINARMVDATTGVVMQTARISAPTPEKLLPLLPQLAQVLLMTDEEKLAFEAKQALEQVAVVQPPAQLPPAPEPLPADQPAPPPVIAANPQPPAIGQIEPGDFDKLPLLEDGAAPPVFVMPPGADPFRDRLLAVSLQVGDNLFLRGRYGDALRHFELALNLSGGRPDIRIRIERCRPFLLPPPVVVVQPVLPPVFFRPRVAVLPFMVRYYPPLPGFGGWVADRFAWQLGPRYDLVDRGELYWYMGRLGITVRDVLYDPYARIALARAMGVRFFVFGFVDQVASMNVRTIMVDAETGYRHGQGFVHVHDSYELKLRMSELVYETTCDPRDRPRLLQEGREFEAMIVQGRGFLRVGNFALALQLCQQGLARRPNHPGFWALRREAEEAERRTALATARNRNLHQDLVDARTRQEQLIRQADLARQKAAREAAGRDDVERKLQEQKRDRAYSNLLAQAQLASKQKQYSQAVPLWQSVIAMKPTDGAFQELAQAKALVAESAKKKADDELAQKEALRQKQQADEAAKVRAKLDKERKDREAEQAKQESARITRDRATHDRFLTDARKHLAENKLDAAIAAAQSAQQITNSNEARQLLQQALDKQSQVKQSAKERDELEKKLADEKAKRESEAKQKQEGYTQALAQAQKALADKQYDQAITQYNAALKFFRTDVALNGLRQAEQAQARDKAQAEAEATKKAEEQKRLAQVGQLLAQGQKLLEAKQYDAAIKTLNDAKKLAPTNVEVLTALSKAEAGRSQTQAETKNDQEKLVRFKGLVKQAQADLAAKKFDDAITKLDEAARLQPGDPSVQALLKQARDGKATASAKEDDAKKTAAEFQKLMSQGQQALSVNQFDSAIRSFSDALKLKPNDATATALLRKAEQAKADAAATAKQDKEDKEKAAQVQKLVQQGRAALAQKNLNAAAQALNAAAKLAPKDPAVLSAMQDLQKAQTAEADAKKTSAQVEQLLKQGRTALAQKNFQAAAQAFNAAAKLEPRDAEVQKALADLQKAQTADTEAAKKRNELQALLQKGQAALNQKQYDTAIQLLTQANKLDPDDKQVDALLRQARQAKAEADNAETKKKQDEEKRRQAYNQAMKQGQGAMQAKRFDDAVRSFSEALKYVPGDAAATQSLAAAQKALQDSKIPPKKVDPPKKDPPKVDPPKNDANVQAQFNQHMTNGQRLLQAKKFNAAAQEFQAALQLMPNSAEAKRLLQQARQGK